MEVVMLRYGLFLLLLTSIASSTESNGTNEETREPRVNGRIVKLYSGVKPEPYLCIGEGFQGDPTNCAVFYRCVKEKSGKFTVFKYQCAPGTVYDPDLETCNHPRNTRRAECGGMKPTIETFHISNINEIDGAQPELPRPISTKVPMYTEHTTLKNPTLSWILSTERQNIPTKAPWGSNVQSTLTQSSYYWSSTQYQTETGQSSKTTFAPVNTQQSNTKSNEPCISDGFMGDSENCRKFYRCVGNQRGGFIKYEFSCSELTVWDDEIQGCNHPWAVKRSKCGRSLFYEDKSTKNTDLVSTEGSTVKESIAINEEYGHKTNKTIQQQLQISHGSKVTQTQTQISNTPEVIQNQTQINYGDKIDNNKQTQQSEQNQTQISYGTAVSQTQTQIDYGNKGVQTQLQIDHSKDSSQSQVQIHDSITDQPTSMTTVKNNNGKDECSESGFMGDTNDCKKFYRCVDNGRGKYTRFEYFCGDGTVWDPEIEACNHAWAVKSCGGNISPVAIAEEPPAAATAATATTTTTTTTKSSEYHTNPTKTTQSYSTASQNLDAEDEDDIGYNNQNNQETIQHSSTTTPKVTTSSLKPATTEKSDGATTECTSSGFIGDANNCKIFYRCVDNGNGGYTKHEFKCGDGTLWDSSIEACNHAWAVKNCGTSTSENVDNEETITKEIATITSTSTPSPNILSTTVTLVQITTQASTQIDDYDTGYGSQNQETLTTTTTTTKPVPQEQADKSNDCKASGFMGDVNDCKKFYRCVDNGNGSYIRYEFTCGEGTVWDPKIEACNHAWAVENCGENGNAIESTETSSQSTHPTSSSDTSSVHTAHATEQTDKPTSTPMTTTTTKSSSTTLSFNTTTKCSSSGFMADSTDCKKFYRCVDNGDGSYTRYEFTCGEGTVWDPKIEACNHAWAVEKCSGNSEPTHVIGQTTLQQSIMQDEEQENEYVTPSYETSESLQTTPSTSSISPTSTTSSEPGHCNKIGFMGDKNDCKKFYRCVDNGKAGYDRYEFQCGEGTAWDSSIEACNHASAVKDCGGNMSGTTHLQNESTTQLISSSTTSDHDQAQQSTEKSTTSTMAHQESETGSDKCMREGFFGSKVDCKKFYRCVDNENGGFTKYEFACGEGTSWNQEIQSCDHISPERPCISTSQVSASSEPVYLSDDMDIQTTSTTKATTTTKPIKEIDNEDTQTTKKPQDAQGICQSDGFYADSSDCRKFYRCVENGNGGYTKHNFNCGDGTVWNQEIQACDHESADKKCSGTATSATNTTESQLESTTRPYSTTKKQGNTDKPDSTESSASEHCTSEGFFPHPNNCKKFIRCVDNGNGGFTRYEFSCGDGTVWVQEIQACDHDNDVTSCSSQSGLATTSKPQNAAEHSSTSTAAPGTESDTPSKENDEYDNENSKEPTHGEMDSCTSEGYFGNSQDCRKFYRCVDNGNGGFTKYDFVCGDGTAWDSNLQTCNHINEVQSCSGSAQENNENLQTTTNKNQAATDSSSSTTKATTTNSESSSSSSSTTPNGKDKCESEGYFGNNKDCKKFFRCVDNGKGGFTKYDFTCGDGTIWDKDITSCNHPQDVSNPSCGSNQGTSDSSSTSTSMTSSSSQTSSSTIESSTSSQSTSGSSQESSKKPTNDTVTCEKAGYYANPSDCKKFYRCVDWDGDGKKFSVFHFECGEGTIWDPALDTCNHEESVYPRRDCTQTQSQNVVGETTTTTTESTTTQITDESTTSTTAQPPETTTTEQATNEPTTTQQSATTEQTTTQQSTTSEQTTTQQSITSEQTTTQQFTTSEQTTTQEPTTSEQTTTQQSTTSEQTTTQQSTTTEQTTTQQITTSEPTTTEQSTSEQTTTQQSGTTEQTTTQQSTTSEQTTTQQTTTNEQTTTQQTTTSAPITTDQSTSEQTTPQQSTSEQTTTQQSGTTEQTTTEQSTSEQTTTQQSTTEQTASQQTTTTDQTTTQDSFTTEQTTTQQSTTTDQTTTQESFTTEQTTTEQTTEGLTTTEETTDQSATQSSSTESDSTVDQSTTESSTTESLSSSEKECPETEEDQYVLVCPTSFRRHPKYCNMFYQCTEDEENYEAKMAMFKCPNNTIYDESQTQCVTEDKADEKCHGEIANKRRFKRLGSNYKDPIVADKGKHSCSTTGYFSFEMDSECSKGFLKCEISQNGKLRGYVYQCPDGYIYWSISKRCERVENVRDCKRSINDWTGRWNIPIERKNISLR